MSTLTPLDREEAKQVLVPLVVGDARALSATVTLTLHVTDLNDNPMSPASRTVTALTLRVGTHISNSIPKLCHVIASLMQDNIRLYSA